MVGPTSKRLSCRTSLRRQPHCVGGKEPSLWLQATRSACTLETKPRPRKQRRTSNTRSRTSVQAERCAQLVADLTGGDPGTILASFGDDAVALLMQPHINRAVQRIASIVKEAGRKGVRGDVIRRVISEEVASTLS